MADGTRYDACTPRPGKRKTWWHRVGSAWKNAEGKITVYLDSVPLPDPETHNVKIMLFERTDDGEERTTRPSGGAQRRDVDDDEIPF